ncbi:MAG: NAD(P)H-hydrate dehydratase [Planctomycetota bacterium]
MTEAVPPLPPRDPAGHKGDHGTVAVIGGCDDGETVMLGAPILAGRAALRSGVGLCKLVMPGSLLRFALSMLPAATGLPIGNKITVPPHTDAVVIGPGLRLSEPARTAKAIAAIRVPCVLDADALNAIAAQPEAGFPQDAILTPHPGEARRLADGLGIEIALESPPGRNAASIALAEATGCAVVLKGHRTVVSDGERTWTCERGHACLGTGGTGDVLAGLLGGLLAQAAAGDWPLDRFQITCIGVQAHALAGEQWAASNGQAGLLAQELTETLPGVLRPAAG